LTAFEFWKFCGQEICVVIAVPLDKTMFSPVFLKQNIYEFLKAFECWKFGVREIMRRRNCATRKKNNCFAFVRKTEHT
jgi:hypothetical protein